MRKKMMALVALCALLAATACSGSSGKTAEESATGSQAGSQEKVELKMSWWGGDQRHVKMNEVLDKFEQKYPNIKVNREFTTYDEYWNRFAVEAAGKNAPDVFFTNPGGIGQYISRGQIMGLKSMVDAKEIDLSNFEQKLIDVGVMNGEIYMVTYGTTTTALYYNKTLFDKIGVAPPEMNISWDQFSQKAKEVQAKLPKGVWAVEDNGGRMNPFNHYLATQGKNFYSKDGKLEVTKDDVIAYFKLWDDIRKSGATPPPQVQAEYPTENPEQSMISRGVVAMQMGVSNQFNAYQMGTKDQLDMVRLPVYDPANPQGQIVWGTFLSMSAHTEHPKEAAMLINYLVNDPDAMNVIKMEFGPIGSKTLAEAIKPTLSESEVKGIAFMDSVAQYITLQNFAPPGAPEVDSAFVRAYEKVAFGQESIEQAADEFMQAANEALQ